MKIKKVKLFINDNLRSNKVAREVKEKLEKNKFVIVEEGYDLAIAIGGDGSFLRMVKNANFNSKCCYVGINAGTLGFAQEVNVNEIDEFMRLLNMAGDKNDFIVRPKWYYELMRNLFKNEVTFYLTYLDTKDYLQYFVNVKVYENKCHTNFLVSEGTYQCFIF